MRVVDLHCDTLYKKVTRSVPLDHPDNEVRFETPAGSHKLQCCAIWLPDTFSGYRAEQTVFAAAEQLKAECQRLGISLLSPGASCRQAFEANGNTVYFTVENGSALNGKLENVGRFASLGVRMMTLTWNAANLIGDGADAENPKGLTRFGRAAVAEMEKHGIIVDISHASEPLFYDVAANTRLPFVASHSDAFSVTAHRRNLTDGQIKVIIARGGLFGLNFHNAFLNSDPESASVYDIIRHAEHFLSLGGENSLCFGSDFDGGVLPRDFCDSRVYCRVYELFLQQNYKESLIRKIFFDNALNFFENFDNSIRML